MGKEPILVIMAAGIGSRYGGLKQIDPVGTGGELIIDFSLFDAFKAGFKRVIFIITRALDEDFRRIIRDRIARVAQVSYAYQDVDDLPAGYARPADRSKPWGTGHALLACRGMIDAPFAVINADDFYGRSGYQAIYNFLKNCGDDQSGHYALAGYQLDNTLTDHGHVARGVCTVGQDGYLLGVHEYTHIERRNDTVVAIERGVEEDLPKDSVVSMNLWGFTPHLMQALASQFPRFLDQALADNPLKAEFFLPTVVDGLIRQGQADVRVLPCGEQWYGVTYAQDKPIVQQAIRRLQQSGVYPQPLWGHSAQGLK